MGTFYARWWLAQGRRGEGRLCMQVIGSAPGFMNMLTVRGKWSFTIQNVPLQTVSLDGFIITSELGRADVFILTLQLRDRMSRRVWLSSCTGHWLWGWRRRRATLTGRRAIQNSSSRRRPFSVWMYFCLKQSMWWVVICFSMGLRV